MQQRCIVTGTSKRLQLYTRCLVGVSASALRQQVKQTSPSSPNILRTSSGALPLSPQLLNISEGLAAYPLKQQTAGANCSCGCSRSGAFVREGTPMTATRGYRRRILKPITVVNPLPLFVFFRLSGYRGSEATSEHKHILRRLQNNAWQWSVSGLYFSGFGASRVGGGQVTPLCYKGPEGAERGDLSLGWGRLEEGGPL